MEDVGGRPSASVAEEGARLVASMLSRARASWGWPPAASARELERVHDPALRGAVTMRLMDELSRAITAAWSRGWQPADLERAARRQHKDPVLLALTDGIRAELAGYARSTVDPRWWQQVDELPVRPSVAGRRSRPDNPVRAWQETSAAALTALLLVERLPSITVLGALPGERQHAGSGTVDRGFDDRGVDDRLLTKVRRLLAQAEGTPYEAEAETFTAAAQKLMARHRIDRALLESRDPERRDHRPDAVRIGVDRPYEGPKMHLLHQICTANRCRSVWSQAAGFATVIGFDSDRRAVELLYTSLLVQATSAMRREGELSGEGSRSRGFRSSFLLGFATRIGQRLHEASRAEETQVAQELGAAVSPGTDEETSGRATQGLELVLQRRDVAVKERTHELFPSLQSTRARQVSDYGGFMQGRAAADRADLGTSGRLGGRAS